MFAYKKQQGNRTHPHSWNHSLQAATVLDVTRKSTDTLPTFCLSLFFIANNLMACLVLLDAPFRAYASSAKGGWHCGGILLLSLAIYMGSRSSGSFSPPHETRRGLTPICLAILMTGVSLLLLYFYIGHAGHGPSPIPYQVQAVAYGLFWPPLMLLFFSTTSLGKQGLCFGCALAVGKIFLLVFLPTLGDSLPAGMAENHLLHLRRLLGITCGILGLTLAWALFFRPRLFFPASARDTPTHRGASPRAILILGGILGSTFLFFALFGIGTSLSYAAPKIFQRTPNPMHFSILLCAPLIGALLDTLFSGKRWGVYSTGIIVTAVVWGMLITKLAQTVFSVELTATALPFFLIGRETMFALLILLSSWLAGLVWRNSTQQIAASFAYCAYILALFGIWMVRAILQENPHNSMAIGTGLASAFSLSTALALYLFGKLPWPIIKTIAASKPYETSLESEETRHQAEWENADLKLLAFCVSFSLTKRESDIFLELAKGTGMEKICAVLGISERTFRFHVSGLLKKTKMLNRQRLLLFYKHWETAAAPASQSLRRD